MRKLIVLVLCIMPACLIHAQRASFQNNQSQYKGITYKVGDTITIAKGSQPDKSFAYISSGTRETGVTDLDSSNARSKAIIEKVFIQRKSIYMNAVLINKTGSAIANKILIDLEAAVDNNEIK